MRVNVCDYRKVCQYMADSACTYLKAKTIKLLLRTLAQHGWDRGYLIPSVHVPLVKAG